MKPNRVLRDVSAFDNSASLEGAPESNDGFVSGHNEYSPIDPVPDAVDPEQMVREIFVESAQPDLPGGRRDYRTGTLTAAVIALSVLLGWMVGRAGWNMAVNRAQSQSVEVPDEVLAAAQYASPVPIDAENLSTPAAPVHTKPLSPRASSPAPKPNIEPVQPDGAVVMYERGKEIFRARPSRVTAPSVENARTVPAEHSGEGNSTAVPDHPPATYGYVLTRVQPHYPEEARQQRIQGAVVLKALVGADGSVQELKVISGDPQLVQAATDAVRQWRFQPRRFKGQSSGFETQITINFLLP
jgi:TonB family protein